MTTAKIVLAAALAATVLSAPAAAGDGPPVDRPVPVVLPATFDVSHDGKTVAFSWRGDVWRVPTAGGAARRLTSHAAEDSSPRFSPDGTSIAFVSTRFPGGQVFVMPSAGGPPRQITWHTDGYRLNGWFPDGKGLLVTASRDAYWRSAERFMRVDLASRTAHAPLFNAYGRDGSLSPGGKNLLFVREGERWWRKGYRGERSAQIWLHDAATKAFTRLSHDRIPHEWPLWHPDGKRFFYVSEETGTRNLFVMDLESHERVKLTSFEGDGVTFPALSRGGGTIVFRRLWDLYAYDVDSGAAPKKIAIHYEGDWIWETEERRLVNRATDVAFTADGKQMAFVAGGDVFVMDREMKEPRRVTRSPEEETEVLFAKDGKSLYYVSHAGGRPDIWVARPKDPEKYWWLNDGFEVARVTDDEEREHSLSLRPDGKRLAFLRGRGDLWTLDTGGGNATRVLAGWNPPSYGWSPDGQWFVYSVSDNDFNSDVWVMKADGSEPFNISRHPDRDRSPVWSPDGKKIAFVGQRTHGEDDVYYVYLTKEDDQTSSRDRKLKKALDAMKKGKKKTAKTPAKKGKKPEPKKDGADDKPAGDAPKKADKKAKEEKKKKEVVVKIDFDGLHERIHRVRIADSSESGLAWSPDSKKLVFNATVKGVRGLHAVEIPGSTAPKKFSTTSLSGATWTKEAGIVGLSGGVPATMTKTGKATKYAFQVKQKLDLRARRTVAFDVAWRTMRDRFYDGGFNNKDWNAIGRKYRPLAPQCLGNAEFSTLVNLMLGELNASHMGFSAGRMRFMRGAAAPTRSRTWQPRTVHLGARWDPAHTGPGLKVKDVVPKSPAAREKSRLHPGDVVLAVDGTKVSQGIDLTTVLNDGADHDYRLKVQGTDGKERTVNIRPTTTGSVRRLLYEKVLKDRQTMAARLSDGKLGYVHISGMNWRSFERFEAELHAIGYGKDGIIIDVRDNGGGSTTDHLLTVLCQPSHAITVPRGGGRGYPQDRRVYATWHKPVVVLCNQNSYSNAEIFSHAMKTLGRAKVVGVQTAGGVISTGGARVLDVGFIRTPFRAWFTLDGQDMELHGAMPHHVVWPKPGELPAGIDRQLEKAVEVLLEDVKQWKATPPVKLKWARQRPKGWTGKP